MALLSSMSHGKTNGWLHTLLPILWATFCNMRLAPARSVSELAAQLEVSMPESDETLLCPTAHLTSELCHCAVDSAHEQCYTHF